jgi:hypothetical protein
VANASHPPFGVPAGLPGQPPIKEMCLSTALLIYITQFFAFCYAKCPFLHLLNDLSSFDKTGILSGLPA